MHTEQEAKTKWCPETRIAMPIGTVSANKDMQQNEHPDLVEKSRCIASQCMHWRWLEQYEFVGDGPFPDTKRTTATGYCGLSGAPS